MEEHRTLYTVRMMSEVLRVSASGYYKWRKEEQSPRTAFDEKLIDLIRVLYAESFGAYGVRRIARSLTHQGIKVNVKRIRRLMRSIELSGKGEPKRKRIVTTDSNHLNPVVPNYLNRDFVPYKSKYPVGNRYYLPSNGRRRLGISCCSD